MSPERVDLESDFSEVEGGVPYGWAFQDACGF